MWIRPWGFKEGCLIGAGLLVTGWLLQITIGEIDWSLFAYYGAQNELCKVTR